MNRPNLQNTASRQLRSGQDLGANQPKIEEKSEKAKAGPRVESSVKIKKVDDVSKMDIDQEPLREQVTERDPSERVETEFDQENQLNEKKTDEALLKLLGESNKKPKSCQEQKIGEVHISRAETAAQMTPLEKERAVTYDAFATPPDIVKAKQHRVDFPDADRFQADHRPAVALYGTWLE